MRQLTLPEMFYMLGDFEEEGVRHSTESALSETPEILCKFVNLFPTSFKEFPVPQIWESQRLQLEG